MTLPSRFFCGNSLSHAPRKHSTRIRVHRRTCWCPNCHCGIVVLCTVNRYYKLWLNKHRRHLHIINRQIVLLGTKRLLLIIKYITSARLEFAMRLLIGLYAGEVHGRSWYAFNSEEEEGFCCSDNVCVPEYVNSTVIPWDGQEYVLAWPERRSP